LSAGPVEPRRDERSPFAAGRAEGSSRRTLADSSADSAPAHGPFEHDRLRAPRELEANVDSARRNPDGLRPSMPDAERDHGSPTGHIERERSRAAEQERA
jgi:hypothetical protein